MHLYWKRLFFISHIPVQWCLKDNAWAGAKLSHLWSNEAHYATGAGETSASPDDWHWRGALAEILGLRLAKYWGSLPACSWMLNFLNSVSHFRLRGRKFQRSFIGPVALWGWRETTGGSLWWFCNLCFFTGILIEQLVCNLCITLIPHPHLMWHSKNIPCSNKAVSMWMNLVSFNVYGESCHMFKRLGA